MRKKDRQRIKKASKLLLSALMLSALSLGSINPANANSNITKVSPITRKEYTVSSDFWIPFAKDYFWRHGFPWSRTVELKGGALTLIGYIDSEFLEYYDKTIYQDSYTQTKGNLFIGPGTNIEFSNGSKITGGFINVVNVAQGVGTLRLNNGEDSVRVWASGWFYIGDHDYCTLNLLPSSFLYPEATLYVAKYGTLNINPGTSADFDYYRGRSKGRSEWTGAINSKGTLKLENFRNIQTNGTRKLKAEGGNLTLFNTKLTLKPESVIKDTTINFDDNNSTITFANNVLNTAYFPGKNGIVYLGDSNTDGSLRVLPVKNGSTYRPYETKTTVNRGTLEFNDHNVTSPTITIKAPITNDGKTIISDAIIANNISSINASGDLNLYRDVKINDNVLISQKYITVKTGTTTVGDNLTFMSTGGGFFKIEKDAQLLNPSGNLSLRNLLNDGKIDGKDGKYGNLFLYTENNKGSIIQNDITIRENQFKNSGYMESKGKFTNNAPLDDLGTGTLVVNNADFNANIKQTDLTVNGNATQKAGINVTKLLSVASTGKIINDNNKITTNSLKNQGTITTFSSTGNSELEADYGNNSGTIQQKTVYINKNFTNDGNITSNLLTYENANISGVGNLYISKGDNFGIINQKAISIGLEYDNSKNITANELLTNSGTLRNIANALIETQTLNNSGNIIGDSEAGIGNLIVRNGGFNTSKIEQKSISFNGGTFDNNGVITATDNFDNKAKIEGDNGILNIKNGSSSNTITQKDIKVSGNFQNNKDMTVKNLLNITGTLINNENISTTTLNNNGTIAGEGLLTVHSGGQNENEISQKDIIFSGGNFVNSGNVESKNNFINNATITGNNGYLSVKDGTNNGDITQNRFVINGTFTNNGNITSRLYNRGSISNNGNIKSSLYNNGSVTNAAGKSIEVNTLSSSGTISGEGNLTVNGGSNIGEITHKDITFSTGAFNNYGILTTTDTLTNNGTFTNYGILSSNIFTNNGTLNFEYDEKYVPISVINKMNGTGTTNIKGGIVSLADVTQNNINVQNSILSLVDDNTDNRVTANTNFSMSNNARLAIDVDLTNQEGDYFKSDRIIANMINDTVVNVAYANLLNIPNEFASGKIKLFNIAGANSSLTINKFAEVVNGDTGDIFAYVFEQDTVNKGDMNINKKTVEWKLPDVIQANTDTIEVSAYKLKKTETLDRALGNLTDYPDADPRQLTIYGNNNIIDGNGKAGVNISGANQRLTLKDVTMQNFIGNNSCGVINNSGQLDITNVKFDKNKADGNYPNGGAIYNTVSGKINNLQADFTNNEAGHSGGAIYNMGVINSIKGKFERNRASIAHTYGGGAIMNYSNGAKIQKISSDFIANSARNGGAIYNDISTALNIIADDRNVKFDGNYVLDEASTTPYHLGLGGAVYNAGTVGLYALAGKSITFTGDKPSDVTNAFDVDGIYNADTLNINGNGTDIYTGTVSLQAVGGTGNTNIYGGTVTANDNFTQNILNNQGIFNFNAETGAVTTLSDNTTESKGTTNIKAGSFTVNGNATQKAIAVSNGATLTTKGNVTTTDGIINAGTLNLLGTSVTINSAITGNGTTNIGDNENNAHFELQKSISQAMNINAKADVLTNVNNIGGAVTNAGVLTLTGENSTIANAISGTGSTVIDGTGLIATANIGQAITINATRDLTANASLIGGDVDNSGTLNLLSGNLANSVTGEGTTNILAGESVSIANGKKVSNLILGADSTLNQQNDAYEKITIGTFNAGSKGNLLFDVGTVDNHDEIEISNSATGKLNLTGINITGDDLSTGTMHLFTGSGTKTLDIDRVIIAISGTNNYYKFTQNSTNKGDIDVLKVITPDVPWTIQEVIAGQTKTTVPGELVPVDVYQLSADMTLDSDLGIFTRYPDTRARELTINGVGHLLDGNNIAKGVTLNSGDILNFNNVSMKNFKDGAIHNDGEVSIIAQGGRAVKFEGNYLTTDEKGGAIYNGKTGEGDDAVLGTLNLIAKTAEDSITFVGGTGDGKYDIDGIYNDGILDINADYDNIYSGTINLNTVNGTGETNIYGGNVTTKGDIQQNELFIYDGATLTANASNLIITDGIDNYGTLNLTGGLTNAPEILVSDIIGIGTTNITGNIYTDKSIFQMGLSIADDAALTIGADNLLTIDKIQNAGTLNLSAGTLEAAVTGTGDTTITGAVIANELINNNVKIKENSSLELDANALGSLDDGKTNIVENNGTIVLAGNTLKVDIKGKARIKEGATVTSDIKHFMGAEAGTLTNDGTFNMTGDIEKDILGTSGITVLQSDEVYVNDGKSIAGILDSNGKELILQSLDEKYNKFSVGGLKGTTNLSIDVDMTNHPDNHSIATDNNQITFTGTSVQTEEGKNAVLNLQDIFAYGFTDVDTPSTTQTYNNFVTYAKTSGSGTLEDNLTLKLNGHTKEEGAKLVTAFSALDAGVMKSREYKFTLGGKGSLNVDVKDKTVTLEQFIDGSTDTEVTSFILAYNYTTADNEIGTTKLGTNPILINRTSPLYLTLVDGSKIIAKTEGETKGITVANGIELTVQGTDFLTDIEQGRMSGFDTALKVNEDTEVEKNILNIEDMIITNNNGKTDIENNATLNFGGSNNEVGTIIGKGSTKINEGKLLVNNELTQNKVTLENGAKLETSADALNVENGIENHNGEIILNGGTLSTNILGLEGLLNIKESELTNNATIIQELITLESALTNNNTIAAYYIDNKGTITNNSRIYVDYIDNSDTGVFNANQNSFVQGNIVDGEFNSNGINTIEGALNPARLYLNNGTLNMLGDLQATNTVANGGSLNLADGVYRTSNLGSLTLNQNMPLFLDTNLATGMIDQIAANSVSGAGKINMMLNVPSRVDTILTNPNIVLNPIANDFGTAERSALAQSIVHQSQSMLTPIYNYTSSYNPFSGLITFAGGGDYEGYNPAVFANPVAAQMGGYLNLLNSYEDAFANMDMTMNMTKAERTAMKMRNKYAAADEANLGTYNPNQLPEESAGVWFRPFASFEKVNLSNGPEVGNNSYGALLGYDSKIYELKNGWDAIFTGYAGYNGSHQHYDGNSIWQNGGQLGATAVFYKGDFFTGFTATAGASVGDANTMYGREDITMLMAGIANKTGYNLELFNGKFIIQPNMLMSYSFVNTFDRHNAAGVNINSDPLHAIQIAPGLKFIGNLPHGWQPYVGVQMVWNIMDKTKVSANNVSLPETSIDPYVQYGVGVQKCWGERFTGFLQAMFRNGGRTGISLSGGFRWALGKSGAKLGEAEVKKSTERNINLSVK